jgi:hypothetical protein
MEDGSNCTEPFEGEERRQKREKRWKQMKKEGRWKREAKAATGWTDPGLTTLSPAKRYFQASCLSLRQGIGVEYGRCPALRA